MAASSGSLYDVLQVSKEATSDVIRKAYYKASLACHPDKCVTGDESERMRRTRQFQSVGEAYRVLMDTRLRSIYDRTGKVPDRSELYDGESVDWSDYFKTLFQSVTAEAIQKMRLEYIDSEEETSDLYMYYEQFEGDMDLILEHLLFSSPEEEPRYQRLIQQGIQSKKLQDYSKWSSTTLPAQVQRRWKRAKREAASVSRLAKATPPTKAAATGRGPQVDSEQDLFMAIAANRQKSQAELFERLERKYTSPKKHASSASLKSNAAMVDPLSDAEFKALQEKMFKKK